MKKILAGTVCFIFLVQLAMAQSIHSSQGVGSLNHQGMPNNFAMGEVGIGTPSIWHINSQNPANLIYNSFSTFQLGIEVDRRNFSGDNIEGSDIDGSLRFLSYAYPVIAGKWSSSFGILPYSSVNYNTFVEEIVSEGGEDIRFVSDQKGEGGLTNLFWANGFAIKKKLYIGVRMALIFGSIEKNSTISIGGTEVRASNANYKEFESYSDLNFLFGMGYRHKLSDQKFINVGAIYSPRTRINGTSEFSLIRLSNSGREIETVDLEKLSINFFFPTTIGFGMSYEQPNVYKLGIDIESQSWKNAGNTSEEYNNSFKIAIGVEYVPKYDDINSYWRRIKYSAGFNYQRLPYIVNNQSLTDFGINFGTSLPVSGFSSLNFAFKWGQLGESSNGLIKETYYKVVVGATINDRWFIKRKYD